MGEGREMGEGGGGNMGREGGGRGRRWGREEVGGERRWGRGKCGREEVGEGKGVGEGGGGRGEDGEGRIWGRGRGWGGKTVPNGISARPIDLHNILERIVSFRTFRHRPTGPNRSVRIYSPVI